METGAFILVLIFGFSNNVIWTENKTAVAAIDSQQFYGFKSLETCNAAAHKVGPALVAKYESVLRGKSLGVGYDHICVGNDQSGAKIVKGISDGRLAPVP